MLARLLGNLELREASGLRASSPPLSFRAIQETEFRLSNQRGSD